MLVTVAGETLTLTDQDGVLHQLPFEPLSKDDMRLQARYHLWIRAHEYRREWRCNRCRQTMTCDAQPNEEAQIWELLAHCGCRALYGTIPVSEVVSLMATSDS